MSKTLQNLSCGGFSGTLIISAILGAIGIALIETIIGVIPGLIFLLVSGIIFVIGLIALIAFFVNNRNIKLTWWCIMCIIVSIGIIIGNIVVTAKYFAPQLANPIPIPLDESSSEPSL